MEKGSSGTSQERMVYVGIGLVFALLLAVYLVYKIAVVVLVLLMTLLFSVIISAPVDYLGRRGVGRGWGTLAVLGALVLVFGIFAMALAPVVTNQATQLVETFPTLLDSAQQIV
ncbi:MAG TPA: AI-2E family transporter, partial [Rubrobacter sp.]|nr:AI-2E family transporter [Rubrobacter sp.]